MRSEPFHANKGEDGMGSQKVACADITLSKTVSAKSDKVGVVKFSATVTEANDQKEIENPTITLTMFTDSCGPMTVSSCINTAIIEMTQEACAETHKRTGVRFEPKELALVVTSKDDLTKDNKVSGRLWLHGLQFKSLTVSNTHLLGLQLSNCNFTAHIKLRHCDIEGLCIANCQSTVIDVDYCRFEAFIWKNDAQLTSRVKSVCLSHTTIEELAHFEDTINAMQLDIRQACYLPNTLHIVESSNKSTWNLGGDFDVDGTYINIHSNLNKNTRLITYRKASSEDISSLDSIREAVMNDPFTLEMRYWHTSDWAGRAKHPLTGEIKSVGCGTSHCIAGWGVFLKYGYTTIEQSDQVDDIHCDNGDDDVHCANNEPSVLPKTDPVRFVNEEFSFISNVIYITNAMAFQWLRDRVYAMTESEKYWYSQDNNPTMWGDTAVNHGLFYDHGLTYFPDELYQNMLQ